jgi:hypothetical protein
MYRPTRTARTWCEKFGRDAEGPRGAFPVRGDMIATGFTVLRWREQVDLFSKPTFPSPVLLVARASQAFKPIKGARDLAADISQTRATGRSDGRSHCRAKLPAHGQCVHRPPDA